MKPSCDCDGFEDTFSYASGHSTRTIHDETCPNHPNNWDIPDFPEAD